MVRRGSGRESVEVLGYSPSARRVLLVWLRAAYWEGRSDDRED
jgi:hypothetical protein